ncbi:MAG: type ISP restriction/modification enzyme, partial [Gracilimonas sp.]
NSLEEHHPDTGTLFASWLSQEANEANHVKRDTPVMVVMGNPPYSGESSNKGEWIMELMEDYKKEPGGKVKLKERNPKWINDDYVKFIRFSQYFIEKNGEGILAFINPHGFLDNPTFRGMRWDLLRAYDKIFVLDLHGNSNKKEVSPDGSPDINVFDIQQGVSINILIKKKGSKNINAKVFHQEFYGERSYKYESLWNNNLKSLNYEEVKPQSPYFFFTKKDYEIFQSYSDGFKVPELFKVNVLGFQTHRDQFAVSSNKKELISRINELLDLSNEPSYLKKRYGINESKKWKVSDQRELVEKDKISELITESAYRPFDNQFVTFDKAINDRPRTEILQHIFEKDNLSLLCSRQQAKPGFRHIFVTDLPANDCVMSTTSREANQVFPLYLYPEESTQQTLDGQPERTPNLDKKIVHEIAEKLGLKFVPEKEQVIAGPDPRSPGKGKGAESGEIPDQVRDDQVFAPIDLLDYIYAVLHSPSYREKYKEFLKIDFPRVPYPEDPEQFWQLVELGGELRQIHLLEHPVVEDFITTYPESGDNVISNRLTKNDPGFVVEEEEGGSEENKALKGKILRRYPQDDFELGKVWINEEQYFDNVPQKAWEFYIGGYQPAEKWLKDRRDRELSIEEIQHYQKIIVALMETDRIMGEIDGVWEESTDS